MFEDIKEKERQLLKKIESMRQLKKDLYRLQAELENNIKESRKIFYESIKADKEVLEKEWVRLRKDKEVFAKQKEEDLKAINQLAKEKSLGFPWLAKAYADYFYLRDLKIAKRLETKAHPARKAAEQVRELAKERRVTEKQMRIVKYLLQYYESLFPWLVDFRGEDLDDLIRQTLEKPQKEGYEIEGYDPVRKWLTAAEYKKLPRIEKFQRALDRYWSKKKTKWEIGRDYERYVGYLYETRGFSVYYQGIVEGLADLGRDIIAIKGKKVVVIQCKYWSQKKVIHEKHICQFKGTVLKYEIENPKKKVEGKFYTSTKLSDTAREFARHLEIKPVENFPLKPYPSIKCNVSRRTGEKIYHFPFDQQYDRTLVEEERNECYVSTVEEAEKLGFRRAFRWKGSKTEGNK